MQAPKWALAVVVVVAGCESKRADVKPQSAASVMADAGVQIVLAKQGADSGVDFTYRNGSEAGHASILESLGGGLALFDYDNDGMLDLFCLGGGRFGPEGAIVGRSPALYHHRGRFQFHEVTAKAGLTTAPYYSHGCAVDDYDADGFDDILATGYGGALLFRNQGDGTFLEMGARVGLHDRAWSTSAGWGDLNADGMLDLYIAHYVNWSFENHPYCRGETSDSRDICSPKDFAALPDSAYFSNGDETFVDVSDRIGLSEKGKGLGVLLADVDLDADLDVYVANDTTDNFLYINRGNGVLDEMGLLSGAATDRDGLPNGSMGVALCDFNRDGAPDIWVTNYEHEATALYRNEGKGDFLYVSDSAGITALGGLFVGFGVAPFDVDRDGDQDFAVANGHVLKFPAGSPLRQQPLLLLGEGSRFRRCPFPPENYFGSDHMGRGVVAGDIDNDGDCDLAFSHNEEPVTLIANESSNRHQWLMVELVGVVSNRNGVGSQVSADGQYRQVAGGGSYLSHGDRRLFWGIPDPSPTAELAVIWPSGQRQTLQVATNRYHLIVEPAPGPAGTD